MAARGALAAGVAALLAVAGCGGDDASDAATTTTAARTDPETTSTTRPPPETTTTTAPPEPDMPPLEEGTLRVVAAGLEVPWDVAITPDGRTLVSERDRGRLLELSADGEASEVRLFQVEPAGEGGLLGLAVSPTYERDGWLYAYFTSPVDNRIVRFTLDGAEEELLTGIPSARNHNGGVLEFGPDGKLYAGTGDAQVPDLAQDRRALAGKILRLEPDGSVPPDNPGRRSPVWSYGHRNVQGLAWSGDGTLYATELGPDRDDEVNRIEPGRNYGWPEVTGQAGDERYVDPIAVFGTEEASPSGAVLVDGGAWDGDLVFAGLRGQRLWRLVLDDGEVVDQEAHLVGELGRIRNVVQHPDGQLWILTSNRDGRGSPVDQDDRIVELVPPPP